MTRLHEDQVDTDVDLLRRLLADQLPEWADLPVTRVREFGTDHHLYRLGEDLVARLPIIGWAVAQAHSDATWLPRLAPHVPVALPVPLAWESPATLPVPLDPSCPGCPATPAAADIDRRRPGRRPGCLRAGAARRGPDGRPAEDRDLPRRPDWPAWTRACASPPTSVALPVSGTGRRRCGRGAVDRSADDGPAAWIHGDLMTGNLLDPTTGGFRPVIDWGGLGVGDPAPDLCPVRPAVRRAVSGSSTSRAVGYDDATRRRARGWIVAPAVAGVDYYAADVPGDGTRRAGERRGRGQRSLGA